MTVQSEPVKPATATITGHSVLGTPITARRLGNFGFGPKVLVFGAIHGNESAGIAIARRLVATKATIPGLAMWVDPVPNWLPRHGVNNSHDLTKSVSGTVASVWIVSPLLWPPPPTA